MKNLERAIRVYRALVESPVKVDSSALYSWPSVERALAHAPTLLTEMRSLPGAVFERVMSYVGEFSPLVETRSRYIIPQAEIKQVVREIGEARGVAAHLAHSSGGLVAATGEDMQAVENIVARHGGKPFKGPTLSDAFERVDTTLPEAMMVTAGLDPSLCESALVAALYGAGGNTRALSESATRLFAGIKVTGQMERFQSRLEGFCRPRPILGVSRRLAEAVRLSGRATPAMIRMMEAGEAGVGVASTGGAGVNAPGSSDRGGIAKDQPDARQGTAPPSSRNGQQKAQSPPTEHVPSQETGANTNSIRLPDGTEVPMDTMRQAFAKMLHNMATQVEQGTVGGQPTPRGADQMDAAGAEPPQASTAQQQVAAQTASQQAAGNGAEPAQQPVQANGQTPVAPGAPPPPGGPQSPALKGPADAAPEQPAAAPAPGQPPAPASPAAPGQPDVEGMLAKAEQGDEESLKQVQGMQGQMTPEQKQRLQAIIAKKGGSGGGGGGAAGAPQESVHGRGGRNTALINERDEYGDFMVKVGGRAQTHNLFDYMSDPEIRHEGGPDKAINRLQKYIEPLVAHNLPHSDVVKYVRMVLREDIAEAESTPAGRKFVSGEIHKLVHKGPSTGPQKGRPYGQKQAVAAALNVARKKGYKVGAKPHESVDGVHEGGEKFSALSKKLGQRGDVKDPHALAAWIGRKKYGKAGFQKKAAAGRSHESFGRTNEGPGFVVWEGVNALPVGILPAGLDYGVGSLNPGSAVAILESGKETCVVRLPNGDVVRTRTEAVTRKPGSGFVGEQCIEVRDMGGMMEALASQGVTQAVVISGPPTSGRGYFIRTKIAPWARRMQERVALAPFPSLEALTGARAREESIIEMRLSTAREDHAALGETRTPEAFDAALVSDTRFRHVVEGRGMMLRDAIPWALFQTCRESFDRYYAIPAVKRYYSAMGVQRDALAEAAIKRMVSERRSPAFVQMGKVLVVDANASANLSEIAKAASKSGLQVIMVEMRLDLDTVLTRGAAAGLREAALIKNYNAARRAVDEARRAVGISRFITYTWHGAGGPFEGRFVCEAGDDKPTDTMPGKNDTMAVVTKNNIDGKNAEPSPKAMVVMGESVSRMVEALDTGQAAESESCASGMKEAGEQLKAAREAVFKLTTSTLVQCSSMAQATGAKRTQRELEKAQQFASTFLDDLQALATQVDKANEAMKAENGGMGGDNLDAMKQMAANGGAAPAAPATPAVAAPAPAAPTPVMPPAAPMESIMVAALNTLMETDIPDRVAAGEDYRTLNEAISGHCPMLDVRQRCEVIDRIRAVTSVPLDASMRVQFNPVDHRMLAEAVQFGSVARNLVKRTHGGVQTLASSGEMRSAISELRKHGRAPHLMLADTLESATGICVRV